jgi:hypothetical protein
MRNGRGLSWAEAKQNGFNSLKGGFRAKHGQLKHPRGPGQATGCWKFKDAAARLGIWSLFLRLIILDR